jgi:serine/threonine-protein kinase
MLTGQPPYLGESIPQLCAALLHDDPIPLRQHRPEVPPGLEQAVLRCLMKDRNQRFPTVFELGRALLPFAHPDSRIHVERAERVLRVTDATVSGMPPLTERASLSQAQSPTPAMSVPITPLAATPAAVLQPVEPTVNSWGQSGMVAAPKKRGPLVAIGLVAALLAAIGGLLAARASSSSDAKSPAPAAPSLEAKAEVKPAPLVEPTPPLAEPAVTPDPPVIATAAPAPVAPAAAAAPSPKTKPPSAAVKPAPKKAEPKPEPAVTPPPKPGGITDFGGRR